MTVVGYSDQAINQAVSLIKKGGVVAFPTETYYGLAVDPFNEEALARLFAVKCRPLDKAILCLIDGIAAISFFCDRVEEIYNPLMAKFWPGPLTLLFKARLELSPMLTCDRGTIGLRVSSDPVAHALCREARQPVTATSANLSGKEALTTPQEVEEQLGSRIDLIIDGGRTPGGLGSTIVGTDNNGLKLVRSGAVGFSELLVS